jgi:hypothetical protein
LLAQGCRLGQSAGQQQRVRHNTPIEPSPNSGGSSGCVEHGHGCWVRLMGTLGFASKKAAILLALLSGSM